MVDTTIATLSTQTSFTLNSGSTDDDAYNNLSIVVEDVSTSTQKAVGMVLDYEGSTKTVTLKEALAFTIAATDKVYILAENSLKSTVANRQLDVTATGAAGIDWGNVENPSTAVDLSATDIRLVDTTTTNTDMRGTDNAATAASLATVDGKIDTIDTNVDAVLVDTGTTIPAQITALNNVAATDIVSGGAITTSGGAVSTVSTLTGHTPQTGDNFARLGAPAGASVSADVAAVKADTAATLVDTAEIGTAGAGLTDLGGMSTGMKAEVNAEALDVLVTDTHAESSGVPAATASLKDSLVWLKTLSRNKITQTATTQTLRDDADGADIATSTVSDDGTTFTRGEYT